MANSVLSWHARFERRIEWGFLFVFLALLGWNVLDLLGLSPWEPGWRPLQSTLLASGLVLQAIAALVRPRSRCAFYFLLALSLLLLVISVQVAR